MIEKIGVYRDPRNKNKPWAVRWFGEYNPATERQRRYSRSFRLKVEAEAFQADQREAFRKGTQRDAAGKTSLSDFCDSFLRVRKADLRSGTVSLYENTIKRLLSFFGPDCLLSNITPQSAAEFIAGLTRIDGQDKPLCRWTAQLILRNCKTLFQTAVEWQKIMQNPFTAVRPPKCTIPKWHYITPGEYKRLLGFAGLRWKCFYGLAYCCGLRFGELFSLTWGDIDFNGREVTIQNQAAADGRPPFFVKDYETRTIPIPEQCLNLLIDLRLYNEQTDETPYVLLDERQYRQVLVKYKRDRENNRPWRNQDMAPSAPRRFQRDVGRAGIIPTGTLTIHTLRKSCITNWANENPNPEIVRTLAGHSDLTTTMKYYSQATKEQKEKAANAIDRLLTDVEMTYESGKGA
ncbi:MAG TPA: tyrosine-type recombinase/integrase [Sedimentisphaerales bacterium]|nr:tyrosine-type recombinase/integrase [Sedimentisphaerales bacterium]